MKSWNFTELSILSDFLKAFVGLPVQSFSYFKHCIAMQFYLGGELKSVVFDLTSHCPVVVVTERRLPIIKGLKHPPLILFLKKHFIGAEVKDVRVDPSKGRVLFIEFCGSEEAQSPLTFEVRLFPKGANFIAVSGAKQVSSHKPLPLSEHQNQGDENIRPLSQVFQEWEEMTFSKKISAAGTDQASSWEKQKKKVERSIEKMQIDLNNKKNSFVFHAANQLREKWSLDGFSETDLDFLPKEISFTDKANFIFTKEKQLKEKIGLAEQRISEMSEKLKNFEANSARNMNSDSVSSQLMQIAKARGRTVELPDGRKLFIGKSAKDNLLLLRKAKAWDYWFHLRNEASAHGILPRQRGEVISREVLLMAATKFVESISSGRPTVRSMRQFDIVVAECRYVKPIKGDKHGKVTFQNEMVLSLQT